MNERRQKRVIKLSTAGKIAHSTKATKAQKIEVKNQAIKINNWSQIIRKVDGAN